MEDVMTSQDMEVQEPVAVSGEQVQDAEQREMRRDVRAGLRQSADAAGRAARKTLCSRRSPEP